MRVNTPNVVHETIDGEAILLNLKTGNYYSFEGLGAFIWNFVDRNAGWSVIPKLLADAYEVSIKDCQADTLSFITKLEEEELIVEDPLKLALSTSELAQQSEVLKEVSSVYAPPKVNKYSDMQDLLLLDPIHDVDQKGWPKKKES